MARWNVSKIGTLKDTGTLYCYLLIFVIVNLRIFITFYGIIVIFTNLKKKLFSQLVDFRRLYNKLYIYIYEIIHYSVVHMINLNLYIRYTYVIH